MRFLMQIVESVDCNSNTHFSQTTFPGAGYRMNFPLRQSGTEESPPPGAGGE